MGRRGLGRLLFVGVLGILAVLGTAGWVLLGNAARFRDARDAVTHTRIVLTSIDAVLIDLLGAESASRGYASTGMDAYLPPFEEARRRVDGRIREVRGLTADNPSQQERCGRLATLAAERMALSSALVESRKFGGAAAALEFQSQGKGRDAMERVRDLVMEMRVTEESLLAERTAAREAAEAGALSSQATLLGTGAVLLVAMAVMLGREFSRRSVAETRLQAILDHSPAVVYLRDVAGRFLVINRRYAEVTGIDVANAIGKTPQELYAPDVAAAYATQHERVIKEGAIQVEERARFNGVDRTFLSLKFPLKDAAGSVVGVGGISTDITERKTAEEAVRTAKERAEAANRELEAFSYSVSHDLRAPLRGIDGFSLALVEDEDRNLSPKGKEYLQRIRTGAQHMGRLIDDIIELSRVSRIDLSRIRVDLSSQAGSVVEGLRKSEEGRKVDVRVQDGMFAEGDPRLLRVVLENLLGNAWKYTGRKAGAVIEFGEASTNGARTFFVRDDGVGFDMQYAGKLFSPFHRMHSREDFPGTGIGLATVQRIVQRHHGRIWAESAPGRGAAFHFTLGEGAA